jgi:hypothetical protein
MNRDKIPTSFLRRLAPLMVSVLAALSLTPAAHALPSNGDGNYTQLLCADPSTGNGLDISGMPEGLSNPASTPSWQVTSSLVDCGSGSMSASRGVPMRVGQGNNYGEGTWSALLYQVPASLMINGGVIYRAEFANGANNGYMGINQHGGDHAVLYALPRNCCDQGDWFAGNIASRGTFSSPFSLSNQVELTVSPDSAHWAVTAACTPNGNNGGNCTLTNDQWEYRIFGGAISIADVNDPQASNITGSMTNDTPLRSSESVTFSATDLGSGLAYVKLLMDGNAVQSQTVDTNNGRCIGVPGHDPYTWAHQIPCKTSVGGRTYELNTALVHDGQHHVQVMIEDAAGNQSIVVDRTVETNNAPSIITAPSVSGAAQVGSELIGSRGTFAVPPGAGSLSLDGDQWLRCSSPNIPATCSPIPGATSSSYVPVAADVGYMLAYQNTVSDNAGSTVAASAPTLSVPGLQGLSGTSGVTVNNFSATGVPTLLGKSKRWRISLRVSPRKVHRHTKMRLWGKVLTSPRPGNGKLIYLQARSVNVRRIGHRRITRYGKWITFKALRAKPSGKFSSSYTFRVGGRHLYQFRAVAPAEGGYRNLTGNSQIRMIRESQRSDTKGA